jgi:hypothetical protein
VQGDRTSQGITLAPLPGARVVRLRVQFANRPAAQHSACFCLRDYDLNAFSMNTEDFATKPNFREDGIDYAEKLIDEYVEFFTLTVRIPQEMKLARPPYFEVYEYGGEPRLHDGSTSALQPCFHYASLLRTAVLQIPRPAAPRGSLRLSDRLAARQSWRNPAYRKYRAGAIPFAHIRFACARSARIPHRPGWRRPCSTLYRSDCYGDDVVC